MTKEEWIRLGMHFPIGGASAWIYTEDKVLGLAVLTTTLIYEAFNDWRKQDESYKDVLGIVWGFGIIGFILLILRILL